MQILATIALFASSVLAATIAAEVQIGTANGEFVYNAPVGECVATPEVQDVPVTGLWVLPSEQVEKPKCTVYAGEDCRGDEWEVELGDPTHFERKFLVSSFRCVE